ncbi:MAG: hypothetical protein Q7K39_04160 [Candidatus Magasanikbacteria bacterium]|nr:hypothetical protein [Candidatus Magasanikbacteria bacterium]
MRTFLKTISLHPRLVAGIDILLGLGFILWLKNLDRILFFIEVRPWVGFWLWFLTRLGLWAVMIKSVYFPPIFSRWRHWLTLFLFWLGVSSLLIFVDWPVAWYVIAAFSVAAPALSFAMIEREASGLPFLQKPWRRLRLILAVAGVAGILSGLFAAEMFQIIPSHLWWTPILVSLATGLIAEWWWSEYEVPPEKTRRAFLVFVIIFTELIFIVRSWPLGYFASGFLSTWIWFVGWLMLRFYLSPEGIKWNRQAPFLAINFGILVVFLYVVRWH